jgi:signal transduction histidine kinase
VLLVEDNPADVELELLTLRKDGFDVSGDVAQTAEEFTTRIRSAHYDLILADYNLPQWRGTETLEILCRENLDIPLIIVTGYLGEEKAVDYIKQGATDCVLKDRLARLPVAVRRALAEKRLRDQRRQTEEELAQKVAELARSNAELEQFAYVASHDLQEPLRMIANYTQLLAERYRGKLDAQADKYIDYSVGGATRMQALIQDLLKFSRVGRQEIERRTTDCRVVVEQAMKNLQAAIQESGAVVKWNGLPVVMADPAQLAQVFQNLIANAIKFHGPRDSADPDRLRKERRRLGAYGFGQRDRYSGRELAGHLCHLPPTAHPRGIFGQRDRLVDLQENHRTARRKDLDRSATQSRQLFQVYPAHRSGLPRGPRSTGMRTTEVLLVDDNPADTDLTSEILARNGCPSHIQSVTDGVRRSRSCAAKESTPAHACPTS